MKFWETKSGVLRIEDRQTWFDALGAMLFGMLFGGIFGGVGAFLLVSTIAGMFGGGPLIPGSAGPVGWIVPLLFSLPFVIFGAWTIWETFVPVRLMEIRHAGESWEITVWRSPRLFPGCRWRNVRTRKGVPERKEVRRGFPTSHPVYQVRLAGRLIEDFEEWRDADALIRSIKALSFLEN